MIDWNWKIGEAIERIKTRYDFIGRKTGVPFLAIVYPPEVDRAFLREWHIQIEALAPAIEGKFVNIVDITQYVITDLGIDTVATVLSDPDNSENAKTDLGRMWIEEVKNAVREAGSSSGGRTVITVEGITALFPAAGPFMLMQSLWNDEQASLDCPIIVPIPGTITGPRNYRFLGRFDELMYRGDLL